MNEVDPAIKKAKELLSWFKSDDSRTYDRYEMYSYDPDRVKYELHDGPLATRGSWSVEEFIGALIYHEALRIKEETGYHANGSILAHEVAIEFMSVRAAA